MKKTFLEIVKSIVLKSWQMVYNLLKICLWGVAPIFQPATFQNIIATDDAGSNSHISVTTGRGVIIWLKICGNTMFLSVLRRTFSLLSTQKKLQPKNKNDDHFL